MDTPLRLLIVEDNPSDAELVIRRLKRENFVFEWVCVDGEADYLNALQSPFDLILSDWSLPAFNGMRALRLVREMGLDTPFIIFSGNIGEEAAVTALQMGAADYLLKDRPERLGQAIRNALEHKRLQTEKAKAEKYLQLQAAALNAAANAVVITNREGVIEWANPAFSALSGYTPAEALGKNPRELVRSGLHDRAFYQDLWDTVLAGQVWQGEITNRRKNGELFIEELTITPVYNQDGDISQFIAIKQDITERKRAEDLVRSTSAELRVAYDATLRGWSSALELREHETAGHSIRVVQTTLEIARRMGIPLEELVHIQRGALLHDIGKMGIPDSILLKPGKLNEEEWEVMRQHPLYAYNLLAPIPYLRPALDIPYYHHERWDGSGYPKGLRGEEIPLAARIFMVVDVWDALSFDRPYRKAWQKDDVIAYIRDLSGKQFDPRVVDVFLAFIHRKPTPGEVLEHNAAADGFQIENERPIAVSSLHLAQDTLSRR